MICCYISSFILVAQTPYEMDPSIVKSYVYIQPLLLDSVSCKSIGCGAISLYWGGYFQVSISFSALQMGIVPCTIIFDTITGSATKLITCCNVSI